MPAALEGLVAAVSRVDGGVGRAIAEALEHAGAQVVTPAGNGGNAADEVVDAAIDRHGALDVVVLVADAEPPSARIADLTDAQWTQTLDATLNHAFRGLRRALRHMVPRRRGSILVVSSYAAKMPFPGGAAGAAAEHALAGLVKSAAHEVGTQGIRVNAILRGVLDEHAGGHPEMAADMVERSALKRRSRPAEVADVAVMLSSPSLGSVTGCLFPVDGGSMPY